MRPFVLACGQEVPPGLQARQTAGGTCCSDRSTHQGANRVLVQAGGAAATSQWGCTPTPRFQPPLPPAGRAAQPPWLSRLDQQLLPVTDSRSSADICQAVQKHFLIPACGRKSGFCTKLSAGLCNCPNVGNAGGTAGGGGGVHRSAGIDRAANNPIMIQHQKRTNLEAQSERAQAADRLVTRTVWPVKEIHEIFRGLNETLACTRACSGLCAVSCCGIPSCSHLRGLSRNRKTTNRSLSSRCIQ